MSFYRDHGYVKANVGVPELKVLQDTEDKKTRWIELRIPVNEGERYKVSDFEIAGNTVVKSEFLKPLFKTSVGEYYSEKEIRKSIKKYSVKRLNQLGYFKALEGKPGEVDVQKTPPPETNKVDVKLKLEEQNRNSLTFGAGVSEFEGVFGQLSFQTANFLGRGESLLMSMSAGSRAQNYSLAFTEPFLFDRNITGGFNIFRQDVRYI